MGHEANERAEALLDTSPRSHGTLASLALRNDPSAAAGAKKARICEPQSEAVQMSSHRHGEQVDTLDAHGESSYMVAEMDDLEVDDALVVQSFLDACTSQQSSELVAQESMLDRHVERSCCKDAQ
ncbi:hypothetical protein L7F22_057999 [Adiantum nelumboides]|nr:hypothetical protein [Adiantum nelumboides]